MTRDEFLNKWFPHPDTYDMPREWDREEAKKDLDELLSSVYDKGFIYGQLTKKEDKQ